MRCGDIVKVNVRKGKGMDHFETGFVGVLGRNYRQQYGGDKRDEDQWIVIHPKHGPISWYDSEDLVVIKSGSEMSELAARRAEDRDR